MLEDLHTTRQRIVSGHSSSALEMDRCIAAARSPACNHVFLKTMFDEAGRAARDVTGVEQPLAGLSVSVKDLFDIAGQATAAGAKVLADAPAALADCPAVARLKAAGGVVIGRTNMVEFAFSGVGINPHFGTPAARDGRFDQPAGGADATARIPGGSSSGTAVSVATGAAFIGLGSDTGGSIRIPAALNGIVGFKNTARLVPTEGALPLSTTLDTACAMTRSVRDAMVAHEILAARRVVRSNAPLSSYRLAVATTGMLDALDATVARAFARTLKALRAAGARIEEIPLAAIQELGAIQSTGGFSAAESYRWHRPLLERHAGEYDPRVLTRIQRGASMKAHEYLDLMAARCRWIADVEAALTGFD
ncbi:MAG: amidase, partial [Rhodoferax sp.]